MVFSSTVFLFCFLPAAYLLYRLVPGLTCKNLLLVLASLVFYAFGEPFAVVLLFGSAAANYGFGRLLAREQHRRAVVAAAVVSNLALLVFYKYTGFLFTLCNDVTGLALPVPQISLPIGISFFTFQAMSYVLDVYKGACKPQRSFLNVLLYLSFFPQLVAGPIVKYYDIEQQMTARTCMPDETAAGIRRFICGLTKKLLIADTLAQTVDVLFARNAGSLGAPLAWLGAIAYLFQIYFDFSGYSDMAIGLGHLFGFTFQENFNYPYTAQSMQDFWRRWHISVSGWFKEYLYIPLGGNRKGRLRTCLNKVLVFFCTGLWHGANLTFVVWGLLHGLFLLLEDTPVLAVKKWLRPLRHLYTLLVVCCTFVVFRADTLTQAVQYLRAMFAGGSGGESALAQFSMQLTPLFFAVLAAAIVCAMPVCTRLRERLNDRQNEIAAGISYGASLALLLLCVLNLSGSSYHPFIYFRF